MLLRILAIPIVILKNTKATFAVWLFGYNIRYDIVYPIISLINDEYDKLSHHLFYPMFN